MNSRSVFAGILIGIVFGGVGGYSLIPLIVGPRLDEVEHRVSLLESSVGPLQGLEEEMVSGFDQVKTETADRLIQVDEEITLFKLDVAQRFNQVEARVSTLQDDVVLLNITVVGLQEPEPIVPKPAFTIWIYEKGAEYTKFAVQNTGSADAYDVVFMAETNLLAGLIAGHPFPEIKIGETIAFNVPLSNSRILSCWVICREGVTAILFL